MRTYSELIQHGTFQERFDYLRLHGEVGQETFGFDRYLNQKFYTSREWKDVRNFVIVRDGGWDLGVIGHIQLENALIHHINPVIVDDIVHKADWILDPEFLITTSHKTHNAIHYGADPVAPMTLVERTQGDTKLW